MGSSRLYQFSEFLDVPVSFFFDDMPSDIENRVVSGYMPSVEPDDIMSRGETLELVRMYYSIEPASIRRRFAELVKSLARSADDGTGENV